MLQHHLYMQTALLSTPCRAFVAGRMLMAVAYPLSRAGTNCPNTKAITRAAPLLSSVPCCRRFFTNRDITNRVPVIPVTKPAPSDAHMQTHIQWHVTNTQSMPYPPPTCSEGKVWHTDDSRAAASVCGLIQKSTHAMVQVVCLTGCLTRCPLRSMLLHLSGPVELTSF